MKFILIYIASYETGLWRLMIQYNFEIIFRTTITSKQCYTTTILKTITSFIIFDYCPADPRPRVECTFVTDFDDHIFVAMDAEVILFLHDLVIHYVKEKDRGTVEKQQPRSPDAAAASSSSSSDKKNITNTTTVLKQDFREFNCNTWHLEPTVRWGTFACNTLSLCHANILCNILNLYNCYL